MVKKSGEHILVGYTLFHAIEAIKTAVTKPEWYEKSDAVKGSPCETHLELIRSMIDSDCDSGYFALKKYFQPVEEASLMILKGLEKVPEPLRATKHIQENYSNELVTIAENTDGLLNYIASHIPEVVRLPDKPTDQQPGQFITVP